jgi:hypothetical protein
MVARITTPHSLQKTLTYNEQKVKKGGATCIGENGFLLPAQKMNFYDKLDLFENRNSLNERATTKTLHISLNFSPQENYEHSFLLAIAGDYMARIGFGEQPYLVYHHNDAGHPHVHILTTTIRKDGTRINTHGIGRNQSEIARKFLEQKYGLIKAEKHGSAQTKTISPFDNIKPEYGKSETNRGIANVLHQVLGSYNYCSLPELNAVLKQLNVIADPGAKDGFIHSKKGLRYQILDANGNKIGVPIKASSITGNPTLINLEKRFEKNKKYRDPLKEKIRQKLEKALLFSPRTIHELSALLLKDKVVVVTRQNDDGRMYGITFVDNENKIVCNGSEIGRQFSIAGLLKIMNNRNDSTLLQLPQEAVAGLIEFNGLSAVELLMQPENDFNPTPYALKKKKRRRKR